MNESSQDKIAVVTGSSKGIGKAIAHRLAAEGYHVCVTYHSDEAGGRATVAEITESRGTASLHQLDVRSESSVAELMGWVDQEFGHLNVLINNAVKEIPKNIEDASFEDWKTVIETKLNGAWLTTKYALPLLKKGDNSNVVMITTHEGEKPNPDYLGYGVANAALIGFTKAMTSYLPRYGIRVNAVSPGEVRTPLWYGIGYEDEDLWREIAESNPMKRVATVEDVADAVLLLINDPHRFLNGNFLYVNGGSHLKP